MWDAIAGVVLIVGGAYLLRAYQGKTSKTDEGREYWDKARESQPTFSKYAPPAMIAFGVFRLGIGLLS